MRDGLVAGELSEASSRDSVSLDHRPRLATLDPQALKIKPDRAGGHQGELRSEAAHAARGQFVPGGGTIRQTTESEERGIPETWSGGCTLP